MLAAATVVALSPSFAAPRAVAYDFSFTGGAPITASTANVSATAMVSSGLSGIGSMKPRLHFDIRAKGARPITTVKVGLPAGLFFSTKTADLRHGVRVTGSRKPRSNVHKGVLVVTFKGVSSHVQLTVTGSALTESSRLVGTIDQIVLYNRTHTASPHTLLLKLTVTVETGDTVAIKVPVTFTFR